MLEYLKATLKDFDTKLRFRSEDGKLQRCELAKANTFMLGLDDANKLESLLRQLYEMQTQLQEKDKKIAGLQASISTMQDMVRRYKNKETGKPSRFHGWTVESMKDFKQHQFSNRIVSYTIVTPYPSGDVSSADMANVIRDLSNLLGISFEKDDYDWVDDGKNVKLTLKLKNGTYSKDDMQRLLDNACASKKESV